MKLYRFRKSYRTAFVVEEIEVEEKPKTYIGSHTRINKEEINKLSSHYGNEMYCLDNDPKIYIEAVLRMCKNNVETIEKRLKEAKEEVEKWKALADHSTEKGDADNGKV